jgi:hypothetical protein
MNQCSGWQERVALYAGADLAPADASAVESHLAECAECRDFAAGLRFDLEALRQEHQRPITAAHYAAMRARVMERVHAERRGFPWWRWALVPALAAAILLLAFWPRASQRAPVAQRQPARVHATEAVSVPAVVVESASAAPARVHRRRRMVHDAALRAMPIPELPAESPQPMVVKLLTDDPNVVIYWITDIKGGF